MKIKTIKNLLYIFSTVMVLGLALVSFDAPSAKKQTIDLPSPTAAPSRGNEVTATPTPTSTPTPTPTPTPSLAQLNAEIIIRPATDDIGSGLTTVITNHLKNKYAEGDNQVKEISNIFCHYKEGLADVDYFVYASYDILYEGSNVPIPTFEEYLVCIDGENITVLTESENPEISEALFLSRASESVSKLYAKELIRRYKNAKLAVDETLLSSLVTDPSYLNLDNIRKTTEYIEEYRNLDYLFFPAPDNVNEITYFVFLADNSKIINISTLAVGGEEYIITLDENNYPLIFFGMTSDETDAFIKECRSSSEYQLFKETHVDKPFAETVLSDPDLFEFIQRITNATGSTE